MSRRRCGPCAGWERVIAGIAGANVAGTGADRLPVATAALAGVAEPASLPSGPQYRRARIDGRAPWRTQPQVTGCALHNPRPSVTPARQRRARAGRPGRRRVAASVAEDLPVAYVAL